MNMFFSARPGSPAFTLIEVMVAMAILSIMLVFLGSLIAFVTLVSSSGRQQAEDAGNARALLDLISRELEACVNRPDLPNWITASSQPPTLAFYSSSIGSALTSSVTATDYRGLSYIKYQLSQTATNSSLERGDQAVLWTDNPAQSLPLGYSPQQAQQPPMPVLTDVLDGVVAFQISFLQQDGTYSPTYTTSSIAVGVSLALADSTSYNLLISSNRLSALDNALAAAGTSTETPKMAWEGAISTPAFGGYPAQVKTGLRFFERFVTLPTPAL